MGKDIVPVKTAIDEDTKYTVEDLENITKIYSSAVLSINRKIKVSEFVPPSRLTQEQKHVHVEMTTYLLCNYEL